MSAPSDPTAFPRDEAVEATAAAWLAERDGGLSAADAAAFAAWRAADPRHEQAVQRLERAWASLQGLREYRPEARMHPDRDLLARAAGARVLPFRALAATAALAACLTLGGAWFWLRSAAPSAAESHAHYATTVGGYQRMTLPDGSIVDLNANTEIREQFTAGERRVALVRGEAAFQVTKNPARPFIVQADGVAVRAVGTAFNVRLKADCVQVLVTEGRVHVDPPATLPLAREPLPEIGIGQRVSVPTVAAAAATAPAVENVSPAVVRAELSWREPRLRFLEAPLAEVVRQFNARNRVQIELGDADLAALPVEATFRAEDVEAFVRLLTSSGEMVAVRAGPDRIVIRRAR
ncbi:MAG: FecR domain-containing protein [Candidatus Didemnitutus sp.]|nr:FecR domain-containing protein [Candidatus Didemnitutus sp.]